MRAVPALDGYDNFEDKCNLLRSSLFPAPSDNSKPTSLSPAKKDLRLHFKAITEEEITHALRSTNQYSALGHDGITNRAPKTVHKVQPQLLCQLFNVSLDQGHFPSGWKHATCVIILKPGQDLTSPSSWRPILLLSISGKILKYLAARRIMQAAIGTRVIAATQF